MADTLSHISQNGDPTMVDVSEKTISKRSATARTLVSVPPAILELLKGNEIIAPKGAVFQTAVIAGIMAAKKTGELIPLCHPIGLDNCSIEITISANQEIQIDCTTTVSAKTGVEMEALVGASVAALTVYDMCKAISHDIVIKETLLMSKTGGKKNYIRHDH